MPNTSFVVSLVADDQLTPQLNRTQKEVEQLGVSAKKLRDIPENFEKIKNSSAALPVKVRGLKRDMEALALAGRDNSEQFRVMKRQLDDWTEAQKRAKAAVNGTTTAMTGSQSIMTKLTGAGAVLNGVMGMVGGASGDAAAKILQVQSSLAMLQGMSAGGGAALANPWVAAGAAAVAAGAAWVNYNKQMEETLNRTEQFTGLSGRELLSLRNGIKSVASTWGKDYNDVLATVDGLMSQFGIDGETALKAVRDGFVSGADDAGRMEAMISQYAGSFHDAGISVQELIAIIGNTRSGIFSEEGMAVIQMGAKNIRDMSTSAQTSLSAIGISAEEMKSKLNSGQMSTMEAIQQISSRLKTLPPQSEKVGAVLQDIFGKKGAAAGYQLVTALADVETNLDVMKKQTGDVGVATERLQGAHRRLEDAMSAMFMTSEGGFETMATTLKADVLDGLADVLEAFIDLYNESIVIRAGVAAIAFSFRAAWDVIKGVLKVLMGTIKSLAKMLEGVLTLDWDKIKEGWDEGIKDIVGAVADAGREIADDWRKSIAENTDPIALPVELTPSKNGVGTVTGGGGSNGGGTGNNGGSGSKGLAKATKAEAGSIADLQSKIRALDDELNNSAHLSAARIAQIRAERRELERQIQALKDLQRESGAPMERVEATKPQALTGVPVPALDTDAGKSMVNDGLQSRLDAQYEVFKAHRERIRGIIDSMRGDTDEGAKAFTDLALVLGDSMSSASDKAAVALGTVGTALQQIGGDGIVAKTGAVMAAIGQAILGFATASAQAEVLGPFGWLAFVGAGLGTLTSMISALQSFNAGGIVEGNSFTGDRMLARVNAGEMILTRPQQSRLFSMLDGGGMGGGVGTVVFDIAGDRLVGVINNYNKKMGRAK